jgi:hypothetical protein
MRALLPQLRNTLAPGPIQGQWNLSSKSIFSTIAQALKYEQAVRTNINSIPSPWARALLFQSVFLSDQYPNRKELINEYIGFLAVLAFAKVKDLPIQAKAVKLNELTKANPFADSLVGLLPSVKDSLLQLSTGANPWETIYTFTLNEYPLGFTTPATLVVPSIWLSPQLSNFIPWLEEVSIQGPGNRGKTHFRYGDPKHHLGQQEKSAFSSWLNNLKQSVLSVSSPNQDLSNRVGMIIEEYITEIGVASINAPAVSTSVQIFGVTLNPKPLDALAQVIDPGSIKRVSNVEVQPGIKPHASPLYFVDKAIVPQVLSLPSHEICVAGATTLAAFQAAANAGNQLGTFWNADNFFLPRMRWFRGTGILSGSWLDDIQPDKDVRTIIPPINPEIGNFFGSDDLKSRLKMAPITTSEGNGVRISFELEISGINNQPTRLAISKDYAIKSEDELQGQLPYISLWPDLPSESRWSIFYLAVQETKEERSNSSYAFAVEMPTNDSKDSVLDGDLGTIYRIWQTSDRPTILSLIDKRGDHLGIIPIRTPKLSAGRSGKWTIGVDFGTSFTNLHVSKAGSRERLEISSLTLNITDTPENFDTNKDFFVPGVLTAPPDGSNPPMATLLTVRGKSEAETTPEFITNSRLYVPSLDERSLSDFVVSDIKWTKPKYLDAFLTALINMVSAHAAKSDVGEITWKASYPTAFATSEVSRYKNAWDRGLRAAGKLSSIRHKLGSDGTAATAFQTESIAFAQYFADELREQLVYTTCLDVGGGTSDISIWKDMTLVHQLSIPFAGRDIFHNTLRENISRVGEVFGLSDDKSNELLQDLKNSGDNFDAYLDSYLRLKGGTVLERLRNASSTDSIQKFRGLLALSYAGLYYYIGLVLRYLNQDSATPVYLGGNGSRFINWIDPDGHYSETSEINQLLSYVLAKAGGFSTDEIRDTVVSKFPKQEAAGGLIVDETQLKGLTTSAPDAYAGIRMKFETDIGIIVFNPQDEIELPEECQDIKSISIEDFTEIGNFLEVFNEAIRSCGIRDIVSPISTVSGKIALDEISFDLGNQVKKLLNSRRRSTTGGARQNYEPDPGFIVAHKALLRVLAKKWSKS